MRYLLFLLMPALAFGQAFSFKDLPFMQPRGGSPFLSSLVALWPMDEDVASGTRTDVVGGNNLADDNSRIPAARGLFSGSAIFVNGNSDSLSHADNSTLGMGAGVSFTMTVWVMGTFLNTCHFGERSAGGTVDYDYEGSAGTFGATDLGGTLRTITITPSQGNLWHMVAIGFDNNSGLMWQQFDAGARSTLAISGVRKSGQPFRITMNAGNVDQVALWKRSLSTAEITTLYNSRMGQAYPFTSSTGTQYANTWSWAVQHNGGAAPAAATVTALGALMDGFISDSLLSTITYGLPMVSDSLVAARTPHYLTWQLGGSYFIPIGNDPAVNHNFVSGDLTVNGLAGDGSTKYLDTGVSGTSLPSASNIGVTVYDYNIDTSVDDNTFGYFNNLDGTQEVYFKTYNLANGHFQGLINRIASFIDVASPGNGYYSLNRTTSALITGYFANSGTAHASFGSDTGSGVGTLNSGNLYCNGVNYIGGPGGVLYSKDRLSYADVGSGLSSANSALKYSRIQTFRVALGGGYR